MYIIVNNMGNKIIDKIVSVLRESSNGDLTTAGLVKESKSLKKVLGGVILLSLIMIIFFSIRNSDIASSNPHPLTVDFSNEPNDSSPGFESVTTPQEEGEWSSFNTLSNNLTTEEFLASERKLGVTSIQFQVNSPQNGSIVTLGNDTVFNVSLTETSGIKFGDVDLYLDGILNQTQVNLNADIVTDLLFTVTGLLEGTHDWFIQTTLKNGTMENTSTYVFEVENQTATPIVNYTNGDLYNIPDDNNYYTVWLYVNFTEFLNETNATLTKNKTEIKDDIVVKIKQTYSTSNEKFKLKTKNSSILFMVMKGKDVNKMLDKILVEKNKSKETKDKDFTAVIDVHLDPVFGIDANPNTGDNKVEVKGNKANFERPDGSTNLTGAGYSITVIDTGVNYSDPEFGGYFGNGTVIAGYDYCATTGNPCSGTDSDPLDFNSHGSHVAGILAAQSFGIAPNATIIAIKACNDDGQCSGAALMAGIDWSVFYADTWNISAILMSVSDGVNYSVGTCPNFFGTAIQSAIDVGIPIITSTGNEGFASGISYPSCDARVYAVGSTDYNSTNISNFSNGRDTTTSGLFNIIHAPGGEVKSVCLGSYCVKSGTSMAAPHVAATFLMVKQLRALDSSTDDDGDGIDDYDFDGDGNFTINDTFDVMRITGRGVGNSTHKKLDIWATVQYFQNHPAIREEEDRTFNANAEIQFPIGTLSSNGVTDLDVDQCVVMTNNFVSVNDSDPVCAPLINITTDITINKLVNLSSSIPTVLKNGEVCSLFYDCQNISFNASGELIEFTTNSFSNYSLADLTFALDGAPGDNKNEVKVNKVHPKQESGINLTGAGYSTCVIDSGVNYNHTQFDNFLGGYDYCASNDCVGVDTDPFDLNGHGTSVSGIIFSRDYGIAPGAGIVSVKVADADGDVSANAILGGIDWCINKSEEFNISAIVISISDNGTYNSSNCPDYFQDSLVQADSLGILVVASAGNGANANALAYPSCEPVVFSTGATKEDSTDLTDFTNNGQNVKVRNLFAPGDNITTTNVTAGLSVFDGTSLSAPHVAAAKILVDQAINLSGYSPSVYDIDGDSDWDNDDVFALFNLSGYRVGNGKNVKLDIWAAINYIRGRNTGEPAIRPEEDRLFNSEGEVQYTSSVLSANTSLEDVVEECATMLNNFIGVNDELIQCSYLRDINANLTMDNLPLFTDDPSVFRDDSLCSLFFCPEQSYDNVTQIMTFSVLSFSNYTVNGTEFNFTIDETSAPNVDYLRPVSGTTYDVLDVIEIGANVTDNVGVDTVLVNITYPDSTVVQLSLSNVDDWYNTSFTIPILAGQFDVLFIAKDVNDNVNTTETTTFFAQVDGVDITPPTFVSTVIDPLAVVNGTNVSINATVTDNIEVDSVWVVLDLVNGTSVTYYSLPITFVNTNDLGRYNVTFYANDTLGNNAIYVDYFESFLPTTFNFSIVDFDIPATDFSWEIFYRSTSVSSSDGNASSDIPDVLVDLLIKSHVNRLQITLEGINITSEYGKSFSVDKHAQISGYLVTYGVNTTFNFAGAKLRVYYDDLTVSDEANLQLHKCANYDFDQRICIGTWVDVTGSSSQNTGNNYFEYETSTFSGFSIKQYIPPVVEEEETPPTDTTGGAEDGAVVVFGEVCVSDWICSSWLPLICPSSGVQIRTCEDRANCVQEVEKPDETQSCTYTSIIKSVEDVVGELIISEEFDISLSLNDSFVVSSDELSAVIVFDGFGFEPTSVGLTFVIFNEAGVEVYRKEDSVVVINGDTLEMSFKDLGLPEGKYELLLYAVFEDNVVNEFRQSFEITSEEKGFDKVTGLFLKSDDDTGVNIFLTVGIILAILIGVILLLRRWSRGKDLGYRFESKLETLMSRLRRRR